MEVVVDILCLCSLEKSKTTTVLVDEKKRLRTPALTCDSDVHIAIFEGSAACKSCVLKTNVAIDIIIQFYGGR
jgi:hypothetical protein